MKEDGRSGDNFELILGGELPQGYKLKLERILERLFSSEPGHDNDESWETDNAFLHAIHKDEALQSVFYRILTGKLLIFPRNFNRLLPLIREDVLQKAIRDHIIFTCKEKRIVPLWHLYNATNNTIEAVK